MRHLEIRPFEVGDANYIDHNGLTNGVERFSLEEMSKITPHTYTLTDDGRPYVLICFFEYTDNCYNGFFVCDKDMKPRHAIKLKKFIDATAKWLKAKRLETTSLDCDILNRWHKFLGFEKEGTKRKYYGGKDYNIWGRLWE